jgi:hypothetical protein
MPRRRRSAVERGSDVAVLKRLQPPSVLDTPRTIRFDLPSPEAPDLEYWVSRYGRAELLSGAAKEMQNAGALRPERLSGLLELGSYGARIEAADSEQRARALLRELRGKVQALLGAEGAATYFEFLERRIEAALMRVTPHPGHPRTAAGLPVLQWPVL